MLDLTNVEPQDFERSLKRLNTIRGKLPKAIEEQIKESEILSYVIQFDPTPSLSYTKWLMTSLSRDPDTVSANLKVNEFGINRVRNLLAEFDGIKHSLEVCDRDIFSYRSIKKLESVLIENRKGRYKASLAYLKQIDIHECLLDTLMHSCQRLSVHRPRSIEDVIIMTGADKVFDQRGKAAYKRLCAIGKVYVFMTDFGPLVGALPVKGEKGVLIDCVGEAALFEDALSIHSRINWESAPEILSLMIQIDPALPFDLKMDRIEPFKIALTQFPRILHEDRTIPNELFDDLMEDTEISNILGEVIEHV